MTHEQNWIYIKDKTPPIGTWIRVRGWHEITAKYQPDDKECQWEQDDDAPQSGNSVQWRPVEEGECSGNNLGD